MSRRIELEAMLKLKPASKAKLVSELKAFVDGNLEDLRRYLPRQKAPRWVH